MDEDIDMIQVIGTDEDREDGDPVCFRPLPNGKLYHVFLSYRDADDERSWVQQLIEKLVKTYKLKCCNHVHDFEPGRKIVDNIKDAIINSVKTIIIISKEYHESYWCTYEAEYTLQMSMELREKIIIPVIKEDCEIPDHLKPFTYIDARGPFNQWLPRLVSAIEKPAQVLVDSKYSKLDLNERYRNFDIVHVEKTKFRWCGCRGKLPFKPRRYIPDSLSSKVFNMTHKEYQDILREISKTSLIKYRHTCQPWIPSILCCVIPFLSVFFLFFSLFLSGVVQSSGNLTVKAEQIIHHEIVVQLSFPINRNTTEAEVEMALKATRDANILFLIVMVLCILSTIMFLLHCTALGTCLKKRSIERQLASSNRLLIKHNLLAGLKFNCCTGTVKVILIYFDHMPCLMSLTKYLSENKNDPNALTEMGNKYQKDYHDSIDGDNDDVKLININMDDTDISVQIDDENPLLEDGGTESDQQDKDEIYNHTTEKDFTALAEAYMCEVSPDFVWDFLNEALDHTPSATHSTRVVCLCEYIEKRFEDLNKPNVSQKLIDTSNDDIIIV